MVLVALAAFVLGALVAINPFHWVWIGAAENRILHWMHEEGTESPGAAEGDQLWTCGMHPQVIQKEPGNCPICGMKLVPLRQDSGAAPAKAQSSDKGTGER